MSARKHLGMEKLAAICRIEQISPFPYDLIQVRLIYFVKFLISKTKSVFFQEEARRYPGAQLVWAQEEHKNMGAWGFVQPRFNSLLKVDGRAIT